MSTSSSSRSRTALGRRPTAPEHRTAWHSHAQRRQTSASICVAALPSIRAIGLAAPSCRQTRSSSTSSVPPRSCSPPAAPPPSPAYDQNIHAAPACAAHRSARRGSRRPAPPSDAGPYSAARRLQSHGSLRPDSHALAQIWPGQPTVASAQIWLGTDLPRPDEAGGLVSAQIRPGSIVLDRISCPDPL
jgi:hypothetical protein